MKPMIPLVLCLSALAGSVSAQEAVPTREHFAAPGEEADYHHWHYTPVVKVGDMVIVSGIPAGGEGSYEERIRRMFEVLRSRLALAGANLADVVELTSYHRQPTGTAEFQQEFDRFLRVHREFFPSHYPAWSAVGTTALLSEGAPVELRAMAVIGSGRAPKAAIPPPPSR
ncbi:Rid family hydrolase [Pseudoxanthomonas beigongshangi]